jgi:hypothetical protein
MIGLYLQYMNVRANDVCKENTCKQHTFIPVFLRTLSAAKTIALDGRLTREYWIGNVVKGIGRGQI